MIIDEIFVELLCTLIFKHTHFHSSNDVTPCLEDIEVTKRLAEAGKIIGVELLDHAIVCFDSFVRGDRSKLYRKGGVCVAAPFIFLHILSLYKFNL